MQIFILYAFMKLSRMVNSEKSELYTFLYIHTKNNLTVAKIKKLKFF